MYERITTFTKTTLLFMQKCFFICVLRRKNEKIPLKIFQFNITINLIR